MGGCSNVWSKYIQACKQVNGFFGTYREFEAIKIRVGKTKETKVVPTLTTKKEDITISKASISPKSKPQLQTETENTYESKYKALQSFMNTCYQELTASTKQESQDSLLEQLAYASLLLKQWRIKETLSRCILSNTRQETWL